MQILVERAGFIIGKVLDGKNERGPYICQALFSTGVSNGLVTLDDDIGTAVFADWCSSVAEVLRVIGTICIDSVPHILL